MLAPVKLLDTFNHDLRRTRSRHLGAHLIETFGQINHFGLSRRVFNNRCSFGKDRRHHDVFGAGHRHHIRHDAASLQTACASLHVTVINFDFCAHHLERLDMLIHGTCTD